MEGLVFFGGGVVEHAAMGTKGLGPGLARGAGGAGGDGGFSAVRCFLVSLEELGAEGCDLY